MLADQWERRGLKQAVEKVTAKMEPLVKDVVNSVALSPDGKRINARLNQVLRSRVLKKDTAWVLLEPRATGTRLERGAVMQGAVRERD